LPNRQDIPIAVVRDVDPDRRDDDVEVVARGENQVLELGDEQDLDERGAAGNRFALAGDRFELRFA
jgi:hypothetical protein